MLSHHGPFVSLFLRAFVLTGLTTLGFAQQPFLPSEQWIKLRDEANGAAPYENLDI